LRCLLRLLEKETVQPVLVPLVVLVVVLVSLMVVMVVLGEVLTAAPWWPQHRPPG
jgi:hypothetical protein